MLDDLPDKEEIKSVINFIHRGIGIDGLPPVVLKHALLKYPDA